MERAVFAAQHSTHKARDHTPAQLKHALSCAQQGKMLR
jgi:hypothetical protein